MSNANVRLGIDGVDRTAGAFTSARKSMKSLRHEQFAMGRQMKRNRRVVQQAGMQISDFAVQVGGGQSAILAFTQNAPQFVQSFGAIGGAIAAIISIGGVLALIWHRTREKAKPLIDTLDDLAEAITKSRTAGKAALADNKSLAKSYGNMAREARDALAAIAEYDKFTAMKKFGKTMKAVSKASETMFGGNIKNLVNMSTKLPEFTEKLKVATQAFADFREMQGPSKPGTEHRLVTQIEQLGGLVANAEHATAALTRWAAKNDMTTGTVLKLVEAMNKMESVEGVENQVQSMTAFSKLIKEIYPTVELMPKRVRELYNNLNKAVESGAGLAGMKSAFDVLFGGAVRDARILEGMMMTALRLRFGRGEDALMAMSLTPDPRNTPDKKSGGGIKDVKKVIDPIKKAYADLATSISKSMGDAFMSMVDGTKSVSDAFRGMARDIIKQLYDVLVIQRLVGTVGSKDSNGKAIAGTGIAGWLEKGLTGFNLFGKRAAGGPVSAGQPYIVGERGPEIMIPNRSGAVIANGKGGGGTTINMSYQFQGGVTQADLASALPRLVESTKRAIIDATQRGGAIASVMRG